MSNCPDPCSILRLQSFCKFHALAEHNRSCASQAAHEAV